MEIKDFVTELSEFRTEGFSSPVYNPYSDPMCRCNLQNYLYFLKESGPKVMIVGEAPGHRGCKLTGIPFTDEKHLKSPDDYFALGDWERNEACGNTAESTAGKVWGVLEKYKIMPIMWNAFPFHPYALPDKPNSNRKPKADELKTGLYFVKRLIAIFGVVDGVYALGRTSQRLLGLSDDQYIRHPSYDYKNEFEAQFFEKIVKPQCQSYAR